jgi:hypothetical protein
VLGGCNGGAALSCIGSFEVGYEEGEAIVRSDGQFNDIDTPLVAVMALQLS